jgi:hypothetical protein
MSNKQRHGCLAAYLIVMMVLAVIGIIFSLLAVALGGAATQPLWTIILGIIVGIFNLVCLAAVWRWQKWGFYGILGASVFYAIISFASGAGMGVATLIGAVIGMLIFYGVLQIGGDSKGWSQLD